MATMAYVRRGSVMVVVHGELMPTPAEWTTYVDDYLATRATISRIYVHTEGGGPSSGQRRQLADAMGDSPPRTAVLTDSLVARGIVTAMAWLKGNFIRAFPRNDAHEAMQYLDLDPSERGAVLAFVQEQMATFSPMKAPRDSSSP